jgi:hypothetical protein
MSRYIKIFPEALSVNVVLLLQEIAALTEIFATPERLRLFEAKCPLITLALTSALPVIVSTLLDRLQLVPEVPVWPVVDIVKF